MLKKQFRLKKKYQFNYTFKSGQTKGAKHLLVCYTKSKNKCPKIGLAVTKKVGNAVTRNRTKRLLRVAMANYIYDLKKDLNIIIIARPDIVSVGLEEIKQELLYCLTKAELFNEKNI